MILPLSEIWIVDLIHAHSINTIDYYFNLISVAFRPSFSTWSDQVEIIVEIDFSRFFSSIHSSSDEQKSSKNLIQSIDSYDKVMISFLW